MYGIRCALIGSESSLFLALHARPKVSISKELETTGSAAAEEVIVIFFVVGSNVAVQISTEVLWWTRGVRNGRMIKIPDGSCRLGHYRASPSVPL